MILNYIWIAFFLIALVVALIKTFNGDTEIFVAIVNSTFENAESAFTISIGLTGVLCLWMGIMKIGEMGGAVNILAKLVGPFFNKLFPDVPPNHPARGSMMMNFSANMLGLDNAATPVGLKAMNELQELNPEKDKASNAQIMFLVLNTSGLTLIPVAVMNYRFINGSENPSDVFLPILIATFFSTLIGLITVAIYQKINLFNKVVLAYLGGMTLLVIGISVYFNSLAKADLAQQSKILSNFILYAIICTFILMALRKKVNVYESFVEGAKEGFGIAIKIIPFLVAILIAIGVFRTSGAMDYLLMGFEAFFSMFFTNVDFVHGLPTAIMKPLSGSGARGMMLESFNTYGVDSFIGKLNATLQGATDTTFFIIAVYFGSVGIRKTRYAIKAGLLADFAGIVTAIIVSYMFFGNSNVTYKTPVETVQEFTTHWSENQPTKASHLLDSTCFVYDEIYDTLYSNRNEIYTQMLVPDSAELVKMNTLSIKKISDSTGDHIYSKHEFISDSVTFLRSYDFKVVNGKIKSIRYLGIFD